jgi:hypothetical protein
LLASGVSPREAENKPSNLARIRYHGTRRGGYHSPGESGKKEEALTGEILDKFSQLITTALGLVAALAWNDAVQTLFRQFLGTAGGALAAKIFYAVLVTLIVTSVPEHKHGPVSV